MRASILAKLRSAITRLAASAGHLAQRACAKLSANTAAVLLLVLGVGLLLLGIRVHLWICQAAGTALLSVLISWAIRVLLAPSRATGSSKRLGASESPSNPS